MTFRKYCCLIELLLVAAIATGSAHAIDCDEALRRTAASSFGLDTTWYQIEVLSSQLKSVDVAEQDLALRPISQKDPIGLYTVMATVSRDGRQVEQGQVSLRIRKFADVLVAADALHRHDELSADRVTLQRMDITSLQEQPVTAFEAIEGLRMRRNLAKGQMLTTSALESVPDIEVGREVAIRCTNGLFTVTAGGTAQQSGRVGEVIRVKNRASNKTIAARIIDNSTVAIEP